MPPTTQTVSFKGEKDQLPGPPRGRVTVSQRPGNTRGLRPQRENIKNITRCFADEGCAALAVNLFAGRHRAVYMVRSQKIPADADVLRRARRRAAKGMTRQLANPCSVCHSSIEMFLVDVGDIP